MSYPALIFRNLPDFLLTSPCTIHDALKTLHEYGEQAALIGGGTDLVPMMKKRALAPRCLINLKTIAGLDYIRLGNAALQIGPLVTISALQKSKLVKEKFAAVYEAALVFATPQIQNLATVGGNICRSSPGADLVCALLACGARIKLTGLENSREIDLADFFTGPGSNVMDRDILTEISIPLPDARTGSAFERMTRSASDLAKVSCAVSISLEGSCCTEANIALGAVADRPIRARSAEDLLKGTTLDEELIDQAAEAATRDIAPISDLRSTAAYRKEMVRHLVDKLVRLSLTRAER